MCVPHQRGSARHDFCHRLNHHRTHSPFRLLLRPVNRPPALIPARMVANSRSVQQAISGCPSSSTRTNQKTSFLFPASTKNGIFRSAQHSTASSKLSKRRISASSSSKKVIVVKLHDITEKFASLRCRFSFTGFN